MFIAKCKIKKISAVCLAVVITLVILPIYHVGATQSKSGNFAGGYSLTGNGATDIVTIALAQEGRNGASLGYTEDWCADFVSDCAQLAGQSAAIPAYGVVSNLKDNVINAGGQVVSSPQIGDLAVYDWNRGGGYSHIEIVYAVSGSSVSTIGGNSGRNTSTIYTSEVYKHGPYDKSDSYFTCFVRPNYKSNDDTVPIITDVYVHDVTDSGYYVHCIVKDAGENLSYVLFPTWTQNNGQDDITWERADIAGGGWELNYHVKSNDHNNETGWYTTHIYVYDTSGNYASVAAPDAYVAKDTENPKISGIKITNLTSEGYTITCTVTDNVGVIKVLFPTWPSADDSRDPIWHQGELSGTTATCRINITEHGGKYGDYISHIYAYDSAGNYEAAAAPWVNIKKEDTEPTGLLIGDANGDGTVNNKDVAYIARVIVGKVELTEEQRTAADVNGDGNVNNKDVAWLARYLVGKETKLGTGNVD